MSFAFPRRFLRPQWVVSDSGFEVKFLGMIKVSYSEGEKSVWFWAEPAIMVRGKFKGRSGWLISLSKPSPWNDGTLLTQEERKTIQDRTRAALEFMHVPYTEI